MKSGTAVILAVAVLAIAGGGVFAYHSLSDDGNSKLNGDWSYSLAPTYNNDKSQYYDGTLSITAQDGKFTKYETKVSEHAVPSDPSDPMYLKINEVNAIAPESILLIDPVEPSTSETSKKISKLISSNDCFNGYKDGVHNKNFINDKSGEKTLCYDLCNNSANSTYYITLDGLIVGVLDKENSTPLLFILKGWSLA